MKRAYLEQQRVSKKLKSWKGVVLALNKKNSKVLRMKGEGDSGGVDKELENFKLIDVQECSVLPNKQFSVVVLMGKKKSTLKFRVDSDEDAQDWVDKFNHNVNWNRDKQA